MFLSGLEFVRKHRVQISARLNRWSGALLAGLITAAFFPSAAFAQLAPCPAPWNTASNVYGIVTLDGNGSGTNSTYSQKVNQHAVAAGQLVSQIPGSCVWQAIPFTGFGMMKSQANEYDTVNFPNGGTDNWNASGAGDPMWDNLSLNIIPSQNQYVVGAYGAVPGTFTSPAGVSSEDIIWGAGNTNGGVSLQNIPFPAGAPVLYGTASYDAAPFDNVQGNPGSINAHWNVTYMFSPAPDDNCKDCKDKRGSEVSIHNQSLGEDIAIVGTGFSLHYESNRSAGRAGANLIAVKDALGLGGWTLSVHHALDPMLMAWCAGGSCTPYAVVPKALILGDGRTRDSAQVQAPLLVGSSLQIASEDGSEIYVFDATTWKHVQTLLPMSGAVLYNFGYDAAGQLITVTDGNGNITTIKRDANEHPTGIVSPYGQTTTLAVDSHGYLSKITDPLGNAVLLTNTAAGLLSSMKDANGNLYSFQYDSSGFLLKDTDPAGGVLNLARTNGSSGYSVSETTAQGRASSSQVAFSNTASSTTQQFTNTWTNGLKASESNTQAIGQLTNSVSLPDGTSNSQTLGPDPRWGMQIPLAASETMKHGSLTMNIGRSRVVSLANPADPFSLITQTNTETINGRKYTATFTASTKSWLETTPQLRTTTTVLDAQERVSSIQPTGLALTTFGYDSRGRLASIVEGARTTSFAYDSNGNLASVTNPLNRVRSFSYDAAGRLLTTTLEDGRLVNFSYDANGNLTSITPPGSSTHAFAFTPVNLLSSYTPPVASGSGASTYTFSPDRDVTKITRPDGQTLNYKYDSAGRLSSVVLPTSTLNFAYNSTTGKLVSASVAGGEAIAYSYNGSLPAGITLTGTVSGSVGRTFNSNFWMTSQSVDGSNSIAYSFDKDGLVTKAGQLAVKHNATTGLYTGATLGGALDTISYSTYAEPTSHTAKFGTTTLYQAAYSRDALGRISSLTDTIGGVATKYIYNYDAAGRLTKVKKGAATIATYSYDPNSNRRSVVTPSGKVSATYDKQDRLLTYGSTTYAYTANGEIASKTTGAQVTSYQYDVLGNLIAASLPDGTQLSYVIDAENNRVGKMVNSVLVSGFLYDGSKIVAQLDGNNQVVARFVYGGGNASPDYMVTASTTYRIFADHLGSPRLVVDASNGNVAERIDYDEFGNVTTDTNPGFQPFGFAGGLYDQHTKLVRFGARDYDPSIGRWVAKDPISFLGGDTNLYGYVLNDPINMVDPGGLEGDCICQKSWWNFINGFVDKAGDAILTPMMPPLAIAQFVTGANSPGEVARMATGTTGAVNTNSQAYSNGATAAEAAGTVASVVVGGPVAAAEGKAAGNAVGRAISNSRLQAARVALQREIVLGKRAACARDAAEAAAEANRFEAVRTGSGQIQRTANKVGSGFQNIHP